MKKDTAIGSAENALTLVASADDGYAEGLGMTLMTAFWSLPHGTHCRLIILDPGLSPAVRSQLVNEVILVAERKQHSLCWDWQPLELATYQGLPRLRSENVSTYGRLFLADTTDARAAIWLDSDLLIFRNLLEVESQLTGDGLVAGCQDTEVLTVGRDTCLQELKDSKLPYLNAGFLWMNLAKMRAEDFCSRMHTFLFRHQARLRFHDQTALNSFVGTAREVLPDDYNYLSAPWYRDNAAVLTSLGTKNLHYLGGDKPWMKSQRLSCYTRNLVYHYTRQLLLGASCEDGIAHTNGLVATERLPQNACGLLRQIFLREDEKTEDRFQSLGELMRAHTGHFESFITKALADWFIQNEAPPEKPRTSPIPARTQLSTHATPS